MRWKRHRNASSPEPRLPVHREPELLVHQRLAGRRAADEDRRLDQEVRAAKQARVEGGNPQCVEHKASAVDQRRVAVQDVDLGATVELGDDGERTFRSK